MLYEKPFFKYCLIIFLFLSQILFASPKSLEELKAKITDNTFPHALLNDYEFYLLNNKVNSNAEIEYISHLTPSFETEYLTSIILYKNNDFENAFSMLLEQLKNSPKKYSYYDLLSKTGHILDNGVDTNLISFEKYRNYLKAQSAYENGNYNEAKELFNAVLRIDSTAFEPNFMIAYTYRNLGKYNTALKYFNKSISKEKKDSPRSAKVRIAIGSLFFLTGNYNRAKKLYNEGLIIASETGYNSEKVKALLNLGMILDLEGKTKEGRKKFDEATALAKKIGDNQLEATVLSEYAVSYTYTGEEIKARNKYHESFILFKKLGNKNRLALTAINIGNSYLNISNYKSAIEYFTIGLNNAGDNRRTQMLALRGLGDVYTNLANYTKAIEYYNKSKKFANELEDIAADAKINIGLGVLYYNLQMPQKALPLLKDSESKLNDSVNPYLKLEIEQKIGIIYNSIDSLELALIYLEKSALLAKQYSDIYSEILSNTFITAIKIKQKNIVAANSLLKKTIRQTKSAKYTQLLGIQYLQLSKINKLNSNKTGQINYLKNALKYSTISNDLNTQITANYKLGNVYKASGSSSKAKKYYTTAINIIENNFDELFTKAEIQLNFFSKFYSVYNALIDIYLNEKNFTKAFVLLESSKGKNTNQNLVTLRFNNSKTQKELWNKYYDMKWELKSGLYSSNSLDKINSELNKIKDKIVAANPEVANYFESRNNFSIQTLQQHLNNDEYFISYFVDENHTYAFLLSSKELQVKKLNITAAKLNEMKKSISPYYKNDATKNEITFNKDLFAFNAVGAKNFFGNIVEPVVRDIPFNSKLIFSLPTELLNIPFEFLVTNTDNDISPYLLDNVKFLVETYSISYTPSATVWNKLTTMSSNTTENALLIGDPFFVNQGNAIAKARGITDEIDFASRNMEHFRLEYSENEIESIASFISNEDTYLLKDATETNFKNNVEGASIVHLSTHSFLYKNNPLILFSNNDNENDGFLEVGEILKLNLKSDLVVLSSCKSGLGKVDRAEGIVGMQKAFFDAGAKSVVVSLWDVNDKYTSIFMKYFYSFLSEKISKSEALRMAKIKFRKENNANPYYWAAFTLAGNDKPLKISGSNHNGQFLFLVLLVFLLIILLFYLKYSEKFLV